MVMVSTLRQVGYSQLARFFLVQRSYIRSHHVTVTNTNQNQSTMEKLQPQSPYLLFEELE